MKRSIVSRGELARDGGRSVVTLVRFLVISSRLTQKFNSSQAKLGASKSSRKSTGPAGTSNPRIQKSFRDFFDEESLASCLFRNYVRRKGTAVGDRREENVHNNNLILMRS